MWQEIKNIYHLVMAVIAASWYGFPAQKLTVIGVTGTDGKTTTVSLIYHILKVAGYKTAMISSVGAIIDGKNYEIGAHVTTPHNPFLLHRFFRKAVDSGTKYLVLEVTSHALDQHRVFGIPFQVGVLTNVTHEHLDYHKTYERYALTKGELLSMAKTAIMNKDDESYKLLFFSSFSIPNERIMFYSCKQEAEITPSKYKFKTKLIGEFNTYNILAAIGACLSLGVDYETIQKGIATFEPPGGREEIVYKNGFTVMVDFAHTPNGLENLLATVRPVVKGRLIHVFGSAGKRDFQKRPIMGEIAAKYGDVIILTAEDPRNESPEKIANEIKNGVDKIKKHGEIKIVSDRQEAINEAIHMAQKGDYVVITGKGVEKTMNMGFGEDPWSEHEAVQKALRLKATSN